MESHEYAIRFSPVDFAVEFIEQETGVVMLEEDVICGIAGSGSLYLHALE